MSIASILCFDSQALINWINLSINNREYINVHIISYYTEFIGVPDLVGIINTFFTADHNFTITVKFLQKTIRIMDIHRVNINF